MYDINDLYEQEDADVVRAAQFKAEIMKDVSALNRQVSGDHYAIQPIQPVEFIHRNGLNFLEGCVVKRIARWRTKNGVEDLHKAIHELELLIQMEEEYGDPRDG